MKYSDEFNCTEDFSKEGTLEKVLAADIKLCESNWENNKAARIVFGKEGETYIIYKIMEFCQEYYPDSHIKAIPTEEFFISSEWCGFPKDFYQPRIDHQFGDIIIIYDYNKIRYPLSLNDVKRSKSYSNPHQKGSITDTYGDGVSFKNLLNAFFIRTNFDMSEIECVVGSEVKESELKEINNGSKKSYYWPDSYLSSLSGNMSLEDYLNNLIWSFFKEHPTLDGAPKSKPILMENSNIPFKPHTSKVISLTEKEKFTSNYEGMYPVIPGEKLEKAERKYNMGFDTEFTLVPKNKKGTKNPLEIKKVRFSEIVPNWRNFLRYDDKKKISYIMSYNYSKIMK